MKMEELFAEARQKDLWFYTDYENQWFSPDELEQLQREGRFRWGAENWCLANPLVRLEELDKNIELAVKWRDDFKVRLENSRKQNEVHKTVERKLVVYESIERSGAKLVIDHDTGLVWQQGGSDGFMTFEAAQEYVQKLNREKFASYSDWRLPTLEEAMSLMEPKENSAALYIDPVFDKSQRWIWATDKEASGGAWSVSFYSGSCTHYYEHYYSSVRAVRSGQS